MSLKVSLKKLPRLEMEISAEIPAEQFESYRGKAVSALKKEFSLPGFRKGNVPENIFTEKVPEMAILEEMAEFAINETYPKIIEEKKIEPIGRPNVSITKIARGNSLCFIIKTALMPEVKLADYKKIAARLVAEKEDLIVTDEEVEKTIEEIQKSRRPKMEPSGNAVSSIKTIANQSEAEPSTETPIKEPSIPPNTGVSGAVVEPVLPELTDEFVKTLGDFQTVAEFKEKLKENIKMEKERTAKEKKRIKILDTLVEKSEIELPEIIVSEEQNKLIYQLRGDIERLGLKFDDYLKNVKKTEDDIKKEWRSEAEKRAKIEFILNKIATEEKIAPTEEELSAELKHLLEHNKGVDETRAKIYLSSLLANQKVLQFLEEQK